MERIKKNKNLTTGDCVLLPTGNRIYRILETDLKEGIVKVEIVWSRKFGLYLSPLKREISFSTLITCKFVPQWELRRFI